MKLKRGNPRSLRQNEPASTPVTNSLADAAPQTPNGENPLQQQSQAPANSNPEPPLAEQTLDQLMQKAVAKLQTAINGGTQVDLANLVASLCYPTIQKVNNNSLDRPEIQPTPELVLRRIIEANDLSGKPPAPRPRFQLQETVTNHDRRKFEVQLKRLLDMGFGEETKNVQILKKTKGNVNEAINLLCDMDDS